MTDAWGGSWGATWALTWTYQETPAGRAQVGGGLPSQHERSYWQRLRRRAEGKRRKVTVKPLEPARLPEAELEVELLEPLFQAPAFDPARMQRDLVAQALLAQIERQQVQRLRHQHQVAQDLELLLLI